MIWLTIAALVLVSGTLSSSETALFKLDEGERALAPARVRRLLEDPRSLLVTILLGNLIVNLAFFARYFKISTNINITFNICRTDTNTTQFLSS